jgi:hypothetical protein
MDHETVVAYLAEQQLDTDDVLLAAYRDHFGIVLSRVPHDPAA